MFFKTASSVHFSLPWNSWQSLSWSRTYISPTSLFKVLELQVCHHTQQLCVILRDDTILDRMWVIVSQHSHPAYATHHLSQHCLLRLAAAAPQCFCSTGPTLPNGGPLTEGQRMVACQREATKYLLGGNENILYSLRKKSHIHCRDL